MTEQVSDTGVPGTCLATIAGRCSDHMTCPRLLGRVAYKHRLPLSELLGCLHPVAAGDATG
jgi:hypothetical protein